MVKHSQIICQLFADELLRVFDRFVGLAFKGLKLIISYLFLQRGIHKFYQNHLEIHMNISAFHNLVNQR